jgi:hypothetical protein
MGRSGFWLSATEGFQMARRRRDGSYREPDALRQLRASLTEERRLAEFRKIFGRDPGSDAELDVFIEELTLELYNSGHDDL